MTDQQLLVLRVLLVVPLLGAYFAIAVVLFLGISFESAADWVQQGYVTCSAPVSILGGLALRLLLERTILTRLGNRLRDGDVLSGEELLAAYRTCIVITAVLMELMVFIVLAAYLVTGSTWFLWVASVLPIIGLLRIPSQHTFENWCGNVRDLARG